MFFNFNQNNSGGYFIEDLQNGVCEEVIIEANNAKEAISRFRLIGEKVDNFWNYCTCCGERWNDYKEDYEGTDAPEIYGEPIDEVKGSYFREKVFVHYLNGSFKLFKHN